MNVGIFSFKDSFQALMNDALGEERVKGLGGAKKAVKRGTSSWEKFLHDNPEREVKSTRTKINNN